MTRRRWIADEYHENTASLLGQNAAHLARVLRARVGQEFDIVCGDAVRVGTISSISDDRVQFTLGEHLPGALEREVVLVMAVYKFDRMEWAIEKCTELGASRIVPVIARRTDSHLGTAVAKRVERWRRIAHEAAQQSRRTTSPQIDDPMKLKAAIEGVKASTCLLLNESEHEKKFRDAVENCAVPIGLAIGPEGGWTEDEAEQFTSRGWQSVTLGSTILRAETAAIAAMAGISAILG